MRDRDFEEDTQEGTDHIHQAYLYLARCKVYSVGESLRPAYLKEDVLEALRIATNERSK